MVKRIASIWIVCFLLLACGVAVCQSVGQSLPDAPSAQIPSLPEKVNEFAENAGSAPKFGAIGALGGATQSDGFVGFDRSFRQRDPNAIFRKYLSPRQPVRYYSAGSASLLGRATYAASRTVVLRDQSGKGRLNTSYLLRVLTSVAKDEASTPYWRRHRADPFSDFGSTVGDDAGMNVLHEFAPVLQQAMKSHTPRFVAQLAKRIATKR
ncbi:MAG: hypothetical protein WAL56_18155 [Candidatus Sulfotelmatobacter sp.]